MALGQVGVVGKCVPKKPIVKLLTVEQPSIVIDLLINKIYLASHHKLSSSNELRCYDEVLRTI